MLAAIKHWSYSSLTTFEACPYRLWLDRVEHQPRPEISEDHPIQRGIRVHEALEHYIVGQRDEPPAEAHRYLPMIEELRVAYTAARVTCESAWWFTQDWAPCESNSPDRWLVVKTDVAHHATPAQMTIIDWKTGKSYMKDVKHGGQMQLYATAAFMKFPDLEMVTVKLPYLDEAPPEKTRLYLRPQIEPFIRSFSRRAGALLSDAKAGRFPPKPNRSNCKFCDFGPANGTGVCAYGVAE